MKITSFLVCEDIRNEVGNKHSLIGVLGNSLEFRVTPENKNRWPKRMKLGVFVGMKREGTDKENEIVGFAIKIDYNGMPSELGKGIFNTKDIPKANHISLAVVFNNFAFQESGEIRFTLDFLNSQNEIVETIPLDYILKVSETVVEPSSKG